MWDSQITRLNSIENQRKNFKLSGSTPLLDLLNLSIIRVFGGVSAIISHQIKNIREYTEEGLQNYKRLIVPTDQFSDFRTGIEPLFG